MKQKHQLRPGQIAALGSILKFITDPVETVFVLQGYSGCGKSTLVEEVIDRYPSYLKTMKLLDHSQKEYEIVLTATTNKAAENLASITGQNAVTIHSWLGLRVITDYKTGKTTLGERNSEVKEGFLIFIDEASKISRELLALIVKRTHNCKIIFVGDPAQLIDVGAVDAPIFNNKFSNAQLTEVVRAVLPDGSEEAVHPITALATQFRHTVNTGEFFQFVPDGHYIKHMNRAAFMEKIEKEFNRPDWSFMDSKILGWTNKCVIGYNNYVRNFVKGDPHFQVGDYAVVNSYVFHGRTQLKTDQFVAITDISSDVEEYGVIGNEFELNGVARFFMPKTLQAKAERIKMAKAANQLTALADIENTWIDLRAAFSNTVDKSQGSTYGSVFIDLDDVSKCNSGNQIARMMYVGVSRAKNHVYLTGDLA